MHWLRLHHDTPNDPKWRLVANESGQPEANVLAVWLHMMVNASMSSERGTLQDWDDRIIAASLGIKADAVRDIRAAMQSVVLEGDRLTGWEKRQRASDNAAERVRKYRAAKAATPTEGGDSGAEPSPNPSKLNGAHPPPCNETKAAGNADVTQKAPDVTEQTADVTLHSLARKIPESKKEEDSVASATAAEAASAPLKSQLFQTCRIWLAQASGRDANGLRGLIGKWIAAHGEGAVLEVIVLAQREAAESPISFIEKVLKTRSARHGGEANGSKHDRLVHGLAGAFGDLLDPRPEDSGRDSREVALRYH